MPDDETGSEALNSAKEALEEILRITQGLSRELSDMMARLAAISQAANDMRSKVSRMQEQRNAKVRRRARRTRKRGETM
jgi:prefoldin subunit 5